MQPIDIVLDLYALLRTVKGRSPAADVQRSMIRGWIARAALSAGRPS